jgi:hypothetical protein
MTLGPGEFFTNPAAPHTVRMRLNHGWGWWMGSELVRMGMDYEGQALPVVNLSVEDVMIEKEDGSSVSVFGDEYDVKVNGEAKVEYRITASECQASVQASRLKVKFDSGNRAHRDFYVVNEIPVDFVSLDGEPDPVPISSGLYEFPWDGRDDLDERILLGGKYLVNVETDLTVTGTGWSESVTVSDSVWQVIAKPHASNVGPLYPKPKPGERPYPNSFAPRVRLAAAYQNEALRDETSFQAGAFFGLTADEVSRSLEHSDSLFFFNGHSGGGLLVFSSPTNDPDTSAFEFSYLVAGSDVIPYYNTHGKPVSPEIPVSSISDRDLSDVSVVVLLGCQTGCKPEYTQCTLENCSDAEMRSEMYSCLNGDGITSSLPSTLIGTGVDVVISVPGTLHDSLGALWSGFFWAHLAEDSQTVDPTLPSNLRDSSIRNIAELAGRYATRMAPGTPRAYRAIVEHIFRSIIEAHGSAADSFLYPARYGQHREQ